MAQMAFDLGLPSQQGREDFFLSPANRLASATLDAKHSWPQGRMLLLGPRGSGKSHLAAIWAAENGARVLPAAQLTEGALPALIEARALVLEDGAHLACQPSLFHLLNAQASHGGHILLTASTPPRDWGLTLPDLISRLDAIASTRIEAPDDTLLMAMLVKLFADRQLHVPVGVIGYLTTRMDRSAEAARALVKALDARALAEGRAISRQLAAEVLDSLA